MKIIIKGGQTPESGKPLCHSCKHHSLVIGQNCEERLTCSLDFLWYPDHIVKFRVSSCTEWKDSKCPEKYEMEDIAWKVEARKRGPKGFEKDPDKQEMTVDITPPREDYV